MIDVSQKIADSIYKINLVVDDNDGFPNVTLYIDPVFNLNEGGEYDKKNNFIQADSSIEYKNDRFDKPLPIMKVIDAAISALITAYYKRYNIEGFETRHDDNKDKVIAIFIERYFPKF